MLEELAARAGDSDVFDDFGEPQRWAVQHGQPDDYTFDVGIDLWDSWWDATRNGWEYYPGIEKEEWPDLARELAGHLRTGSPITNQRILANFQPQHLATGGSFWKWIKSLFGSGDASA